MCESDSPKGKILMAYYRNNYGDNYLMLSPFLYPRRDKWAPNIMYGRTRLH